MARTVEDVALMLSAIAGPDPRSPLAISEAGSVFRADLGRDFDGVRVAWSSDLGGLPVDARVRQAIDAQRSVFESLGCSIDEGIPDLKAADEIFKTLRAWVFATNLGGIYASHKDQLKDTVVWNTQAAHSSSFIPRSATGDGESDYRARP